MPTIPVVKVSEVKTIPKMPKAADWRKSPERLGNWRGLIDECLAASGLALMDEAEYEKHVANDDEDDPEIEELLDAVLRSTRKRQNEDEPSYKTRSANDKKKMPKRRVREQDRPVACDRAMPEENEIIGTWLDRLPITLDCSTGAGAFTYGGLRGFASKFTRTRYADLTESERGTLGVFVARIRESMS